MKLKLTSKLKQLFGPKDLSCRAGIAVHAKYVRLVKGRMVDGVWHYIIHQEVAVETEEQWLTVIKQMVSEHQLTEAKCCLVLPGNRYQLLQIDKPAVDESELAAVLAWSIKDLVNVPHEDLVADYFNLPSMQTMQGEKLNVVVTSTKTIKPFIDLFVELKVNLAGIVPEEMVIRNVVNTRDEASLLLSQQQDEEATLQIVKNDEIYFARKLRGFNRIHQYTAQELVDGLIDTLSLEVQRSMDYLVSQLKQDPVKSVLLALPSEHQTLIAEQIAGHFAVDVTTMAVTNQSVVMEDPLSEQFFPALGGALEYLTMGEPLHGP